MNLPPINLGFLKAITDDTGVFQHSKFGTPNRLEGYTTDDNARALITVIKKSQLKGSSQLQGLINEYLSFLFHMQRTDGKMHNCLGYSRNFLDDAGSEDCVGRTLWACGYAVDSELPDEKRLLAKEIFDRAFQWANLFKSPRAEAFAILGLSHYLRSYPQAQNLTDMMKGLTDKLLGYYQGTSSSDWRWFEPYLTYVNGRLPQALFAAYHETKQLEFLRIAEESLEFLFEVQILDSIFVPIGNKGWYLKGKPRSIYDQQSVEAASMTEAAMSAYRVTGKPYYYNMARIIFNWFLGKNTKKIFVYNSTTGACYDGITEEGLNLNQGAEANVCYLSARMEFETKIYNWQS